jgi:hypothetical protein
LFRGDVVTSVRGRSHLADRVLADVIERTLLRATPNATAVCAVALCVLSAVAAVRRYASNSGGSIVDFSALSMTHLGRRLPMCSPPPFARQRPGAAASLREGLEDNLDRQPARHHRRTAQDTGLDEPGRVN